MLRKIKNKLWIAFVVHRALSGVMNGAFYAAIGWLVIITNLVMNMTAAWMLLHAETDKKRIGWKRAFFYLAILATIATFISFTGPGIALLADIHLWTLLQQVFLVGGMIVSDVGYLRLLFTVAPSVFLQKLFVNLVGGNAWDYQGAKFRTARHLGTTPETTYKPAHTEVFMLDATPGRRRPEITAYTSEGTRALAKRAEALSIYLLPPEHLMSPRPFRANSTTTGLVLTSTPAALTTVRVFRSKAPQAAFSRPA